MAKRRGSDLNLVEAFISIEGGAERVLGSLAPPTAVLDAAERWAEGVLGAAGLPTGVGWFRRTAEGWKKEAAIDEPPGGLQRGRAELQRFDAAIRSQQHVERYAACVLEFAWLARRAVERNDVADCVRFVFEMTRNLMLGRVVEQLGDAVGIGLLVRFKEVFTDPDLWNRKRRERSNRDARIKREAAAVRAKRPNLSERSVAAQVAKRLGLAEGTVRAALAPTKKKLATNRR